MLEDSLGIPARQIKEFEAAKKRGVPLFESLIAFLLETAARRSEALALRRCDPDLGDETAFFPDTKNSMSRTVPVQRFTMDLLKLLPQ